MTLHDEVEQRALEIDLLRNSGRCSRCEMPVDVRDERCPNCGSRQAVFEDDTPTDFSCETCNLDLRNPKALRACPMCGSRKVRRNRAKIAPMPSVRTHPYECKKCGNPFSARDVERMAFCDCGSREVIDRRKSKENPAAVPVGFSCRSCWTVLDPRQDRCGNCGCTQALETVVT